MGTVSVPQLWFHEDPVTKAWKPSPFVVLPRPGWIITGWGRAYGMGYMTCYDWYWTGRACRRRQFGVLTYRCSEISAKILSSKFLFLLYSLFLLSFLSHDAPFSQCTYQRETGCPRVTGHNPLRISDLCTGSFLIDLHLIWTLKPIEEAPRAGQPSTSRTSAVCCSFLFFKQI